MANSPPLNVMQCQGALWTSFCGCSNLTSVSLPGTKSQWNAIIKGLDWNGNIPATIVHCTDGDVII